MPVCGVDGVGRAEHEHQNGDDLDDDDNVIGLGALAHAAHQHIAEHQQDQQGRDVEPASCKLAIDDYGPRELGRQMNAKEVFDDIGEVGRKPDRDTHVGERVLEDEIPADDPRENLSQGGVSVRVRAPRDGNHGGQFRVAERRKAARDGHQNEGQRYRWSRAGTPGQRGRVAAIQQQVEYRGVENGLAQKVLARRRCAGNGENSRADHRPDAQGHQAPEAQRLPQTNRRIFGPGDECVDALRAEKLIHRWNSAQARTPAPPLALALSLCSPLNLSLLRSARDSGGPFGLGRRLFSRSSLQFFPFSSVSNLFCVHQPFFNPAYFSTSFFKP